MSNRTAALRTRADQQACSEFHADIRHGLRQDQKRIPSRYFYDGRGSDLFEQITRLPEYYPTETEIGILEDHIGELKNVIADETCLVEFGSGSSRKTEILLCHLPSITQYVAIDISDDALADAKTRLTARFPHLDVVPVTANIAKPVALPDRVRNHALLGFFPGSTIGNFKKEAAVNLLATMGETLGAGSHMIIGVDLKKDVEILHRAYNDVSGVTAEFNLNVLRRANRELGANFVVANFNHEAVYDKHAGRIDMYLVSQKQQDVQIEGETFSFAANERVHTEYSHKYSIAEFQDLALQGGWQTKVVWTDAQMLFSVQLLQRS